MLSRTAVCSKPTAVVTNKGDAGAGRLLKVLAFMFVPQRSNAFCIRRTHSADESDGATTTRTLCAVDRLSVTPPFLSSSAPIGRITVHRRCAFAANVFMRLLNAERAMFGPAAASFF